MKRNHFLTSLLVLVGVMTISGCQNKETKEANRSKAMAYVKSFYDQRLKEWPVEYEEVMVSTRYGSTHVLISGPQDAPPLALIHAMGIGSTMWLPNIASLSENHRVYAIDTIGDLNKSLLTDDEYYPKKGADYSLWLTDLFDSLGIDQAGMIGASMGGWIAMNHAIHAPDRVRMVALLGPMGIRSNVAKVFTRLMTILLNPSEKNKRSIIDWALGENPIVQRDYAEYMYYAVECPGKMGFPVNLSGEELKELTAPVLLFLGGEDRPIGNPQPVAEKAKKHLSTVEVIILPGAGHVMNIEEPEVVNQRLLEFFGN